MLSFTNKGIYCPEGDFYIDPWVPVEKAVITHAHSDHSVYGHKYYLSHQDSKPIIKSRLGAELNIKGIPYNEPVFINGIKITLHPAGHIHGSSQVRLERKGEIWVASGDYKLENDNFSVPFEPVKCHTFITESTFALPVYQWQKQEQVFDELNNWWYENKNNKKNSIIFCYALGKAQRILKNLNRDIGKIFLHGAIFNMHNVLIENGADIPFFPRVTKELTKEELQGSLILAPPSALGSRWMRKFEPYETAQASGWMAIRGIKKRKPVERGFILSDHADWKDLLYAIKQTGAENVIATHGYTAALSRYLRENGLNASEAETRWEGELVAENSSIGEQEEDK